MLSSPTKIVITKKLKACILIKGFLTENNMVPDVPNRPYYNIKSQTPSQSTSGGKIGLVPVLKEFQDGVRAHKRDTPKRGHLVPNQTDFPEMNE